MKTILATDTEICPASVAQDILDKTGQALITGDFALFKDCFSLPNVIETPDGHRTLHTSEDLENAFEKVSRYYKESNITDIVRHCVEASLRPDGTIATSHETRLVHGTALTQDPYPCFSVLGYETGRWKVISSAYAINDNIRHSRVLCGLQS